MSNDEELEEMFDILEKTENISETQIKESAQMLADYEGERFDEHYKRFRKLEYK